MKHFKKLPAGHIEGQPLTALAPMQDVTTLPFMTVVAHYGAPDYFFTEFFRVHVSSILEKHILTSITDNPSNRPVFAQLIGESLPDLERTVHDLLKHPIAGVDLNMGCPAPKVYKKNVGGGLLREPERANEILKTLRQCITGLFTVKMRIGFEDTRYFERFLEMVNEHDVDLLSLHGRTVKEMYRSEVHYDEIRQAVNTVHCPVLANGNITSASKASWVLNYTGSQGVMVGRAAIRNPWIFRQIRETFSGLSPYVPTLADVRGYIDRLVQATSDPDITDKGHVGRMKKFLNFIGPSVEPEGLFLQSMRRAPTMLELLKVCDNFLLKNPTLSYADEPYTGLVARPNCETPIEEQACDMFTSS